MRNMRPLSPLAWFKENVDFFYKKSAESDPKLTQKLMIVIYNILFLYN
jgi:hypothetical protein